jgi:hypothetical protein
MKRMTCLIMAPLLLIIGLLLGCSKGVAEIEIPNGYVGWVRVKYSDATCRGGDAYTLSSVIQVRRDGTACSSIWNGKGLVIVRFFYTDDSHRRLRELKNTGWGKGGEIWGEAGTPAESTYQFFVGSESQFKTAPGFGNRNS